MGSWNPAVMAINGYQRYISPHKGFCCAYRVATGEVSCSEYVKQAIIRNGLFRSLSEIRRRFRDCKESARYLNEAKAAEEDKKKKKKGDDSSSDAACFALTRRSSRSLCSLGRFALRTCCACLRHCCAAGAPRKAPLNWALDARKRNECWAARAIT